jgi:hypothetical protein
MSRLLALVPRADSSAAPNSSNTKPPSTTAAQGIEVEVHRTGVVEKMGRAPANVAKEAARSALDVSVERAKPDVAFIQVGSTFENILRKQQI